ncbi:MAG: DUF2726 domain-containing protein [Candidatus Pacebacteria bacterium]|nr:DUF2726 domain-containing protein [Candidatus Paceibacterota bacterium]
MNRKYYRSKRQSPLDTFLDELFDFIVFIFVTLFRYCWKLIKNTRTTRPNLKLNIEIPSVPNVNNSLADDSKVTTSESRYILKESLVTNAEKEFLKVLETVVGNSYRIESQVPLSGIVKPIDSSDHWTNYRDFNPIKSKSIDFVLYDKDYKPYLAIELDDRSHSRWDRIKRDQIVNEIMKSVGLRIVHIPFSYRYNPEKLKSEIFIENA